MSMLATSTNSNGILQRIGSLYSMLASGHNVLTVNKAPATLNASGSQDTPVQGLKRFEKDVDKSIIQSFEDIIDRLKGPLLIELRKSRKTFQPFAIRLLVAGEDEVSAVPSIVIFCPDTVRELVKKFFQCEMARRLCQPSQPGQLNLKVFVIGHPPRQKASFQGPEDSSDKVYVGNPGESDQNPWSNYVKIVGAGDARCATMGGVLIVTHHDGTSSVYGLTAGHALVQDGMQRTMDGNGVDTEASRRESDPILSSTGRTSSIMNSVWWYEYGKIAEASYSATARSHDWALIKNLTRLVAPPTAETFSFDVDSREPVGPVEIGSKSSIRGEISSLPSFALLPFGLDFIRVYTITVHDGQELHSGASGSWVVSGQNGVFKAVIAALKYLISSLREHVEQKVRVLGHVVADDALGDIYMVPLTDILSDIAKELGAREVRLPNTREEMSSLLLQSLGTTRDAEVEGFSGSTEGIAPPLPLSRTTLEPEVQTPPRTKREVDSLLRSTERRDNVEAEAAPCLPTFTPRDTQDVRPVREGVRLGHFHWVCCICGYPNSSAVDAGCATCCNHWRDECCVVY
ncbi:hypothetical protein IQ07DRAFT_406834 [Pyrenochaeta sp. DS3sAY3a]|nr:hypothetical protein IQ07DRAFT_406834 [Pyrenochaeta sp. DS3sAY3a]